MAAIENVTVLFTDLVGSTELASTLGPTGADELRRGHFSLLRTAVATAGGTEVKNLGDGLMVVFPAASAALNCAAEMQQRVEWENRRSGTHHGLRIGTSVGEATLEEGDYFGEPVIEAARLCALAQGGQVLASALVPALAGRRGPHRFRPLGARTLKGLPEPVEVVELVWEPLLDPASDTGALPLPSRLQAQPPTGVIGRRDAAALLWDSFTAVVGGEGRQIVMVSGEAGVGKTTLVAQLARNAHTEGAFVLLGRCDEDLGYPYRPFAEALQHYVDHAPEALRWTVDDALGGEIGRILPTLHSPTGTAGASGGSDSATRRHLLFEAVVGLLGAASQSMPVVVILDDLHWADLASLQLLRHLAASVAPLRVLIIATARDMGPGASGHLTDTLVALRREPGVAELRLDGLPGADVRAYMEATAGRVLAGEDIRLADAVYRETDGNPFFVGEVVRQLLEIGAIGHDSTGAWNVTSGLDTTALPNSIRQVIASRVARLGGEAARVLPLASVIGREFDLRLLLQVSGSTEHTLVEVMEAAQKSALVVDVPGTPGRYRFAHALIQHTLLQDLSSGRRALAHRDVAQALAADPGARTSERTFDIAHQWHLAAPPVDLTPLVGAFRDAAREARRLLAFDEAVEWYTRAVAQSGDLDARARCALLTELGTTQIRANALELGRATLADASGLIDAAREPELMAEIALAYHGPPRVVHRDPIERTLLGRALAALPESADHRSLRARLLARLSSDCEDTDPEKLSLAQEAVGLAAAIDDPRALFDAYGALFWPTYGRPGQVPGAVEVAAAHVAAAARVDDVLAQIESLWSRFLALAQTGDREAADRDVARLLELAELSGLRSERSMARFVEARHMINAGHFDHAKAAGEAALRTGQGDESSLASYGAQLIEIHRWKGQIGSALEILELANYAPPPELENFLRALTGVLLMESEDPEAAESRIRAAAAESFATLTSEGSWTRSLELAALAELAVFTGDHELAVPVLEQLCAWDGLFLQVSLVADWGPARLYLARLEVLLGDLGAGIDHLTAAANAAAEAGLVTWAALAGAELSAALALRGSSADEELSRRHAREAAATARALGLGRVQARLARL